MKEEGKGLGILGSLKSKLIGDCPKDLIHLIGQPKKWREGATKVLIDMDHKQNIHSLKMNALLVICSSAFSFLVLKGLELI